MWHFLCLPSNFLLNCFVEVKALPSLCYIVIYSTLNKSSMSMSMDDFLINDK